MATIETLQAEVSALSAATTSLLQGVSFKRDLLDAAAPNAQAAADSAQSAAQSAASAAALADGFTAQAASALLSAQEAGASAAAAALSETAAQASEATASAAASSATTSAGTATQKAAEASSSASTASSAETVVVAARDLALSYKNAAQAAADSAASDAATCATLVDSIAGGPVSSVNGMTGAVSLGYASVGAAPSSHTHTKAQITDLSLAWGDITSKPSAFTPSLHSHSIADVTGLQAAIEDAMPAYQITTTAVSVTLADRDRCAVVAAAQTITLPALPEIGSEVAILVGDFVDTVVARNAQLLMGLAEDMIIDRPNVAVTLLFVGGDQGWRVI